MNVIINYPSPPPQMPPPPEIVLTLTMDEASVLRVLTNSYVCLATYPTPFGEKLVLFQKELWRCLERSGITHPFNA